jgi:hypothetical protein
VGLDEDSEGDSAQTKGQKQKRKRRSAGKKEKGFVALMRTGSSVGMQSQIQKK